MSGMSSLEASGRSKECSGAARDTATDLSEIADLEASSTQWQQSCRGFLNVGTKYNVNRSLCQTLEFGKHQWTVIEESTQMPECEHSPDTPHHGKPRLGFLLLSIERIVRIDVSLTSRESSVDTFHVNELGQHEQTLFVSRTKGRCT